jgi:transcriptional regulator
MAKDPVLSGSALSLLILEALSLLGDARLRIARWVASVTDDALRVEEGSLYPALHRLERDGSIEAAWATTENNRQAKYYRLTRAGRRKLAAERDEWRRLADAMAKVVQARPERGA